MAAARSRLCHAADTALAYGFAKFGTGRNLSRTNARLDAHPQGGRGESPCIRWGGTGKFDTRVMEGLGPRVFSSRRGRRASMRPRMPELGLGSR